MSEKKNIYESMNAVMEDCGFVGKDSVNQMQKYKFRGIDAVMNALNPALRKNKVFVVPEVLEQTREERTTGKGGLLIYSIIKVKYTFYAEDGSHIESIVIGEGMDSGDKASNKAMSAAFKYACFQAFCVPTEEMKDSEDDSPEPAPKTEEQKDEAKREEIRKQTVTPAAAKAMTKRLEDAGIPIDFVCSLYKVECIEDMTEKMHANLHENFDKVVKMFNEETK